MTRTPDDLPVFEYCIEPLPPARIGRRWRWELWDGAAMLGAGWHFAPNLARRAVAVAAARRVHERLGLLPLPSALLRDAATHGSGPTRFRLVLRAEAPARAAA